MKSFPSLGGAFLAASLLINPIAFVQGTERANPVVTAFTARRLHHPGLSIGPDPFRPPSRRGATGRPTRHLSDFTDVRGIETGPGTEKCPVF